MNMIRDFRHSEIILIILCILSDKCGVQQAHKVNRIMFIALTP